MRCLFLAVAVAVSVPLLGASRALADDCSDDGNPFDAKALRAHLNALASKDLDGRASGTAGDTAARAYIAKRFACLDLTPAGDNDSYEQAFDDTANVVGYIAGKDTSQIIVVGAHHDHLGEGHLGANDNASGIAALLAIAQAIQQRDEQPARTIVFVAFGAEERGTVGSQYFAKHAPAALPMANVVYDINLDMVGSYSSRGFVAAMGTDPKTPARAILERLDKKHRKLSVGLGGHGERSDHTAFCKQGIPYVFFWTPDKTCYHETCDTVDRVDLPHMAEITEIAAGLVEELASTKKNLAASRAKLGCK
jgi:hypothetical protein